MAFLDPRQLRWVRFNRRIWSQVASHPAQRSSSIPLSTRSMLLRHFSRYSSLLAAHALQEHGCEGQLNGRGRVDVKLPAAWVYISTTLFPF